MPEFDLLNQLNNEISQGGEGSLEGVRPPSLRDDVHLNLIPKSLNLQRFHVLSIDVLEKVLHALSHNSKEPNKLPDLKSIDVVNRPGVVIWEFGDQVALMQCVYQALGNLTGSIGDSLIVVISDREFLTLNLLVEAVTVILDIIG